VANLPQNIITVGVGELKITRSPGVLKTLLGSCIGIVLHDPLNKIGGLLHIMLPKRNSEDAKITKYADTGLPYIVSQMVSNAGASRSALYAKIFGGAKMFETNGKMMNIGEANEFEVRRILKEAGIRITASKTGGTKGYNIIFDTETGKVTCRIFGEPEEVY
jgi:chemotaxis protein CheD